MMDGSKHAAVAQEEQRRRPCGLLPLAALLSNTKQRMRRLVSRCGLVGTFFSTFLLLLLVSLLHLFHQHYPNSYSSPYGSPLFRSWFLPASQNEAAPAPAPAPSPSLCPTSSWPMEAVGAGASVGSTSNGNPSPCASPTEVPSQVSPAAECDLFDGRWVKGDCAPYYPLGSCPFIDVDFDCHKNGRPDYDFLKWRWQPHGCTMPRLDATDFLRRLRGKRLVFVGDSLNRNMWESLVCILHHSVEDKNKVHEISGREHFKTGGFYSFKFEDYQSTVDYVRSPFLVREVYQKNSNGTQDEKLRLDILDENTWAYRQADVIVFNTGHWWTHEKTSRGIDYYQEGDHVYPVLNVMDAYKKALATWARWVDTNIDPNKTQVVFRGYSPTHFRGGQWNSGGKCHKESEPITNTSFLTEYPPKMRALEETLRTMRTPVIYLNISRLTDYRKDGHPSVYRKTYKSVEEQVDAVNSQDCSHWCLPGVPDTWNELLYASLLKIAQGPAAYVVNSF